MRILWSEVVLVYDLVWGIVLGSPGETPPMGTLLYPTFGSLERDLLRRVYIPKGPRVFRSEFRV